MASPFDAIGRVLFWRYNRGSWQYDILCLAIILFIFLTPRSVFDGTAFEESSEVEKEAAVESADSTGPAEGTGDEAIPTEPAS